MVLMDRAYLRNRTGTLPRMGVQGMVVVLVCRERRPVCPAGSLVPRETETLSELGASDEVGCSNKVEAGAMSSSTPVVLGSRLRAACSVVDRREYSAEATGLLGQIRPAGHSVEALL